MHDVVIIGGGRAGTMLAKAWAERGLKTAVISESSEMPDGAAGEWIHGRGAVVSDNTVVVLDPTTADERRMVPCRATVIATGRLHPASNSRRLLGITKLGASFSDDLSHIITDERGRTGAPGVFAFGSAAPSAGPQVIDEVAEYCAKSTPADQSVCP